MDALDAVSDSRSLRTGVVTPGRRGTTTGLADLDALTGGLWPGDLWVITGRTGAGKSVFVLDLARSASIHQQVPTALLLARDDQRDAVTRLLSAEARVPLSHMRSGTMTDDDWARLARRMGELGDGPLRIAQVGTEAREATPEEMSAAAVDTVRRHDTQLFVIDSVLPEDVGNHLRGLKELAAREHVAVVTVLADGPGRPADEQEAARHADVVIRVDRDHDMECDGEQSPRAGEADLAVLRHRRGPISVLTVAFQGQYARFVDMTT
jgi:replicative DNA helicase